MTKKALIIFLIAILPATFQLVAQDIPPRPNPPRLVNDFADILSPQQENNLEIKLRNFHDTTSNQIAIVTVKSLDGYDPAMYAYEIGEKWKVGQKDFDNGIVVLVKPKLSQNDRGRWYIAVGYGLEPAIPDATAQRIYENEMKPSFQNNDYYSGLNNATTVLMALAAGEISAEGYNKKISGSPLLSLVPFVIILIIILIMRSTRNREYGAGGRSSLPFWTAMFLGSSMGRSHGGSYGGFSGGGSGFGGGGSGFGGFGGGSFGGGGAGGSW